MPQAGNSYDPEADNDESSSPSLAEGREQGGELLDVKIGGDCEHGFPVGHNCPTCESLAEAPTPQGAATAQGLEVTLNALLDTAGMATSDEHRSYSLEERVKNLIAIKDYFVPCLCDPPTPQGVASEGKECLGCGRDDGTHAVLCPADKVTPLEPSREETGCVQPNVAVVQDGRVISDSSSHVTGWWMLP